MALKLFSHWHKLRVEEKCIAEALQGAHNYRAKKISIVYPSFASARQAGRRYAGDGIKNRLFNSNKEVLFSGLREFEEYKGISVEHLSFDEWLAGLWVVFGDEHKIINQSQRELIARKVINDAWAAEEDDQLKTYLNQSSTVELFISGLKNYGAKNKKLPAKAFEKVMGPYLLGLRDIYSLELNKIGAIEEFDAAEILKERSIKPVNALAFVGFSGFPVNELELVCSLAKEADVAFGVNYSSKAPVLQSPKALIDLTEAICKSESVDYLFEEFSQIDDDHSTSPLNIALALFHEKRPNIEESISQGVFSFAFAQGEFAQQALIIDALKDHLNPSCAKESAVVFRNNETKLLRIARRLELMGIPFNLKISPHLSASSFGSLLIKLLEFLSKPNIEGAEHTEFYEFLGLLKTPFFDISIDLINSFDAAMKKIKSGTYSNLLSFLEEKGEIATVELLKLARKAATQGSTAEFRGLFNALFSNYLANAERTRVDTVLNTAAHHMASTITTQMLGLKDPGLDSSFFAPQILSSLRRARLLITEGVGSQARVNLVEAARLGFEEYDEIILAGLTTSEFDGQIREVQMEADRLLGSKYIKDKGITFTEEHLRAELFSAYEILIAARGRVHFVVELEDEYGEPLAKSILLEEIQRGLEMPSLSELYESGKFEVVFARDSNAMSEMLCFGHYSPVLGKNRDDLGAPSAPKRGLDPLQLWGEKGVEGEELSPSSLEVYLKCPYRWFSTRYLPSNTLYEEPGPRMRGSLVHAYIENFYLCWHKEHIKLSPRKARRITHGDLANDGLERFVVSDKDIEDAFKRYTENFEPKDVKISKNPSQKERSLIFTAKKRALERILKDRVDHPSNSSAFNVYGFEFSFGQNEESQALIPEADLSEKEPIELGGLMFRGRVDRVDISNKKNEQGKRGIIIYDYKGTVDSKFVFNRLKIQAPLYLMLISKASGLTPVASAYLSYTTLKANVHADEDALISFGDKTQIDKQEKAQENSGAIPEEGAPTYAEEMQELLGLVRLAKKGLSSGIISIAQTYSAGGARLSVADKECKYCNHINCEFRQSYISKEIKTFKEGYLEEAFEAGK